jgi:anhydro-N-acetylmuramic acid kinase
VIAVGLMSGTSLDGIDAARVALHPRGPGYAVETQAFVSLPFAPDLRARLIDVLPPQRNDARAIARLHAELGDAFAAAAVAAGARDADFVASHGLTLAHDGDAHQTFQIGDAFRIREATNRSVVFDFRSADTAAAGHGAPLVPYVDALLLADPHEARVALNLGGIANLTVLPAGASPDDVLAFDSGPANMPIDGYVRERSGGHESFDRDGALARRGRIDAFLLAALLADDYFAREPPKSTGRERYGAPFLARHRAALDGLDFPDAVATLTALTIESAGGAIRRYAPAAARVIASGGGAHNRAVVEGLERLLGIPVTSSADYGIDPDAKEAIAFAILGFETLRERPAGLPRATGARGKRVLGAIAPVDLAALLAQAGTEGRPG